MENFNLRKFLAENRIAPVNKVVESVEEESVNEEFGSDKFMDAVGDFYEEGTLEYEKLADAVLDALDAGDIHSQPHDPSSYKNQVGDVAKEMGLAENKQSARDRRIVEMVQRALGVQSPVAEVGISEDEMVQENPLPKYESIDELMKEIEHGTNEAAHKYKMDKMKSVYEALEAKVGSLEEGEHAEHIDQKAIKQMRKDIAALRKAEEKLRKEYDKKFAVKEKPAKKEAE